MTISPATMTKLKSAKAVPTVANILRVYREATPEQLADGIDWYTKAHSLALALDPQNVERAAGVIAALSPRMDWERNEMLAIRAYADGVASGAMTVNTNKADRIMAGEDVATVLNGPKTVAFAATIADPTDAHAVVVDRHAMSVAINRVTSDDDASLLSLKGVYELYADAYRNAARKIGVSPSVVQAVAWVVWRETRIRNAESVRAKAGRTA